MVQHGHQYVDQYLEYILKKQALSKKASTFEKKRALLKKSEHFCSFLQHDGGFSTKYSGNKR